MSMDALLVVAEENLCARCGGGMARARLKGPDGNVSSERLCCQCARTVSLSCVTQVLNPQRPGPLEMDILFHGTGATDEDRPRRRDRIESSLVALSDFCH